MSEYSELKLLAEAAPEGPWFGPEYAPGTSYVFDVDLGTLLAYESIDSEKDACLRYVAAANPAVVLGLIAEIERLSAQVRLAGVAAEMTVHDAVGRAANDYLLMTIERDALRAECEGLRADAGCVDDLAAIIRQLVHSLSKATPDHALPAKAMDYLVRKGLQGSPLRSAASDETTISAARYEWCRKPENGTKLWGMISAGECGSNLDAEIDAAMSKEASNG